MADIDTDKHATYLFLSKRLFFSGRSEFSPPFQSPSSSGSKRDSGWKSSKLKSREASRAWLSSALSTEYFFLRGIVKFLDKRQAVAW